MIEVYKILTGIYDTAASGDILQRATFNTTRGHTQKLQRGHSRRNRRLHSFSVRVVQHWNSLPQSVVEAQNLLTFERRLDAHWRNHPLRWDHEAPETWIERP